MKRRGSHTCWDTSALDNFKTSSDGLAAEMLQTPFAKLEISEVGKELLHLCENYINLYEHLC